MSQSGDFAPFDEAWNIFDWDVVSVGLQAQVPVIC